MTKLIDIVAGARPNFMKIAPIVRELDRRKAVGSSLSYRLVHTGQHYDEKMSGDFFRQLAIPSPHVNLEVGGGTQAEQTAKIMMRYEALLLKEASNLCLVVGDVNSTMACAIAARKLCIQVAHVEAGIRSGDWTMPEEINRILTDSISSHFFTTSEGANRNLHRLGVEKKRIHFVGNTMIDTLLAHRSGFRAPTFWNKMGLEEGRYFVLTLHRPANVDRGEVFEQLLAAIATATRGLPVVFPVHPRTAKALQNTCDILTNIRFVEPLPYLEFNYLVERAKAVMTDSGGVSEETTAMGVPCLTLRDSTERPETVTIGTNEIIGVDPNAIKPALDRLFDGHWKKGRVPPLWDGRAGERIVSTLEIIL
jgi:UDP-N-acetylglucosamine 2-epimerase (non-hydrolysing)